DAGLVTAPLAVAAADPGHPLARTPEGQPGRGEGRAVRGRVSIAGELTRSRELLGEPAWRRCQPSVHDRVAQLATRHLVQLYQDGRVSVEMRNGEDRSRMRHQHHVLLFEVRNPDREDRSARR